MGIVCVKNLLEEGFQVTGFEKSSYVGGLWHFTDDPETLSVLECKYCFEIARKSVLTIIKQRRSMFPSIE
jgi:cation diffusion facilitator CzcD-associated flavoprotein CzcO